MKKKYNPVLLLLILCCFYMASCGKSTALVPGENDHLFADSLEKIVDVEPGAVVVEGVSVSQDEMETAKETVLQRV